MIAIHETALDADQVQSRVVLTSIVPEMPPAGTAPLWASTAVTSHFREEGAVTSIEVDDPVHPAARIANGSAHARYSRARIACVLVASALPKCEPQS